MILVGITGGIGMGKSTCSGYLELAGFRVIDTDSIARQITEVDQGVLDEIRREFGQGVFAQDGNLSRSELAEIVFRDVLKRRALESILHPKIRERWMDTVETWKNEDVNIGFVVIPLLYETGAEELFDEVICVACSLGTQRNRLLSRGWNESHLDDRINAQKSTNEKLFRANFVIWTEGQLDSTNEQVKMVLRRLGQ